MRSQQIKITKISDTKFKADDIWLSTFENSSNSLVTLGDMGLYKLDFSITPDKTILGHALKYDSDFWRNPPKKHNGVIKVTGKQISKEDFYNLEFEILDNRKVNILLSSQGGSTPIDLVEVDRIFSENMGTYMHVYDSEAMLSTREREKLWDYYVKDGFDEDWQDVVVEKPKVGDWLYFVINRYIRSTRMDKKEFLSLEIKKIGTKYFHTNRGRINKKTFRLHQNDGYKFSYGKEKILFGSRSLKKCEDYLLKLELKAKIEKSLPTYGIWDLDLEQAKAIIKILNL